MRRLPPTLTCTLLPAVCQPAASTAVALATTAAATGPVIFPVGAVVATRLLQGLGAPAGLPAVHLQDHALQGRGSKREKERDQAAG